MKIRVAHLITKLELGGAQQNTLYTVEHLDPERFEAVLICGAGGILDEEARALGRRLLVAPHLRREVRPLDDLRALWELYRHLRRERPAIVHTHSSKAGILGRLAARLAGVPVILHTFHGFGFTPGQAAPVRWAYVLAERLCATFSTRLIFVSRSNLEEAAARGLGWRGRYVLIRSGVRLSDFPAAVADKGAKKAALGLGMHKPLVLSVGNFKPQKNPEDFVRLARRVLDARPEARFCFVGDGPLRTKLEAGIVREKLHGKLALPGWRRDAAELLACADVFVLTSLWEGLPRALVEAMKSGVPCVCYATDGVRDLIVDGENGFLVAPGDWSGAADKVARLIAEPALRERMGKAAAAAIGPEFDIDGMVRRQEELYGNLVGPTADLLK